jgi:hypothetical protein
MQIFQAAMHERRKDIDTLIDAELNPKRKPTRKEAEKLLEEIRKRLGFAVDLEDGNSSSSDA